MVWALFPRMRCHADKQTKNFNRVIEGIDDE